MPLAIALSGFGALMGAAGAAGDNSANKRAGDVVKEQVQDVARIERQQREQEAARMRARLRVIAAESGTQGSVAISDDNQFIQSLIELGIDIFPFHDPDPTFNEDNPPAAQNPSSHPLIRRAQEHALGTPPRQMTPGRDMLDSIRLGSVAFGPGSWASMEQQVAIDQARTLHIVDRNLFHELRAISAGVAARSTNPMLAAFSGGMQGATAGINIAGAFA